MYSVLPCLIRNRLNVDNTIEKIISTQEKPTLSQKLYDQNSLKVLITYNLREKMNAKIIPLHF